MFTMYCIPDVVIIKVVTGRASASVKTSRKLIALYLGFYTEKAVCQHSYSSDTIPAYTVHCNI